MAVNPTAHSLACLRIGVFVTADAARLATGVGGSPFTGRVSHPLDGKQSFMTSPHRHSPLTSLAWSHHATTPWDVLAAADCFTVAVWTPRGLTRFTVLVLSHLASRRVQIAGISAEPDGPGVTQLMRNATDAEDGCLRHSRVLIHDRDPLFRPAVRDPLPPADVTPIRRPARAPNLNAYTERFVRTIKDSCLERMVLIGEGSLRRARPPRTESPGARQSPDPAAVDGTATPWSRPVPPAARWDVELLLSVSSVIQDRPSTPRSSF